MQHWLDSFHVFLLILLRVSVMLVVAPIFGHRFYLARAKIGLAFAVSLVVYPLLAGQQLQVPTALIPYILVMVREVIMGLILGYVILLLFVGIQFAGQMAGMQMGFGIVNVFDPQSHSQISIIARFLNILAILLVLSLDGHHMVLRGMMASFEAVPLGGVVLTAPVMERIIMLSAQVFVIAVKISAPMLICLFLVSVALGILARTVPQMNVFIVGFPVQMAIGLTVLVASLPLFQVLLTRALAMLERDLMALVGLFV